MGRNVRDKWMLRAVEYEEILDTEGIEAAGKYMRSFDKKFDKFLEGFWLMHVERVRILIAEGSRRKETQDGGPDGPHVGGDHAGERGDHQGVPGDGQGVP